VPEQRNRAIPSAIAIKAVALSIVVILVVFFTLVSPANPLVQAQSGATQAAHETVVGSECRECHEASHDRDVASFALDVHGKSAKFLKDARAARCETCHGNAEKHMGTGKAEDIINPAKLPSEQANATCLKCHSGDQHVFAWKGGSHDRKDMSCLSCHNVHHAKSPEKMLAAFTVEDTCLRCHTEQRKALFQRSTHLFRTEQRNMKVGCASCHNPHGGEGEKMLLNHTVNNLCYTCHAEKRGPFLWEHPPVRENCMNCHSPHGSNNTKLLTARASLSCQQCHIHMLPRHSTTAGKPLDIWSLNRGCINCHAQVHGSNHPGGRTFTR
jgi:DmsE family decaheme c-type cytochrome